MAINTANIDKGMDVYDSEGEKVGKIEDIIRDPRLESAMDQYRDAATANVGTTAEADDADGEGSKTLSDRPGGFRSDADVVQFAGSTEQGGMVAAGASGATASPLYGAVGALHETDSPDPRTALDDDGQDTPGESNTGAYIHVKEGGLLGLGGKDLFIPARVLGDFSPGDCVSLNITRAQAEERYANRPE